MAEHKAGFVSIIGKPNVGKSTLMNALVGERISIITSKAQTTRHRIMGILSGDDFQIVYSDTPGIIQPKYELHNAMMRFVNTSLEDADIILFVTDIHEAFDEHDVLSKLEKTDACILLLINKIDTSNQKEVGAKIEEWKKRLPKIKEIIPISALHKFNLERVFHAILENLPFHPAYFPKDELTDKPERFFVTEIIREKILENYEQEVPYSCEVLCKSFKESENLIKISVEILVEREGQKAILIGTGGEMLKKVGTEARKDMETFFQKKVFLEQVVKVAPDWRRDKAKLKRLGYIE
ncbi:MAG: GTPase Era [Flammeovirgaceae bacterium]